MGRVKLGCHLWVTKMSIGFCVCRIVSNHQIILRQNNNCHLHHAFCLTAFTIFLVLLFHSFCLWGLTCFENFPFFGYMPFTRRADVNADMPREADLGTGHIYMQHSPLPNTCSCLRNVHTLIISELKNNMELV